MRIWTHVSRRKWRFFVFPRALLGRAVKFVERRRVSSRIAKHCLAMKMNSFGLLLIKT
jgi:hypothetical protein